MVTTAESKSKATISLKVDVCLSIAKLYSNSSNTRQAQMKDQGSNPTLLPQPCIHVSVYELEIFTQKGTKRKCKGK